MVKGSSKKGIKRHRGIGEVFPNCTSVPCTLRYRTPCRYRASYSFLSRNGCEPVLLTGSYYSRMANRGYDVVVDVDAEVNVSMDHASRC